MAKATADSVLDAPLDKRATGTVQHVCAGQPADRAAAISQSLANRAITGANFSKANGDVNGRKSTIDQATDISVTGTGSADHVAIIDGTELLEVTTCALQALTAGGTVTIPAYDSEFADPT